MKLSGLDLGGNPREFEQERLQNMPSGNGRCLGSVDGACVGIGEQIGTRAIIGSLGLCLVGEPYPQRL